MVRLEYILQYLGLKHPGINTDWHLALHYFNAIGGRVMMDKQGYKLRDSSVC